MSAGQADEPMAHARPLVMSEDQLASLRSEEHARIARRSGRPWLAIVPGFYQPVHLLARLGMAEFGRPTPVCWGYRAALCDEDARFATGSVPVHLLGGIEGFTEASLNRNRRRDLRDCRQRVEFVRVREPSLLVEQGYGVFQSANRRLGYWKPLTMEVYRARAATRALDERRFIVAGIVDGRLGGYLESYAVDGILYTYELHVATEALVSGISTGLYVETIAACARAGTVRSVCAGLHTPERPSLCQYKDGLGFRVVHVPARSVLPAPIGAYIRRRRPAVHYRLTGVRPASLPGSGAAS